MGADPREPRSETDPSNEQPQPELATNDEWRGIMVRARKDHGLSQKELGVRVGTSQNVISLVESGQVGSSTFIMPICEALSIPPPKHFVDDGERQWWEVGHVLRARSMKKYQRALDLLKAMIEDDDDVEAKPPGDTPKTTPTAK